MSQIQDAPLSGQSAPEGGFVRRALKRLDAWFTAQLMASDPPWSSDPKVSAYGELETQKEKIAP